MARRGRRGLEPEVATKPAPQAIKVPAPAPVAPSFVMPGTTPDLTSIDLSNIQIPNLPVVAPPVAVAPPPPPVAPAPAPVPIPQIDPAVLAQIQEQFNIPAPAPVKPAPAPAPVKEVAPPPPPRRIEEPPKAPVAPPAPPVKVPLPPVQDTAPVMPPPLPTPVNPPKVIPGESGPIIANPNEPIAPPPVQVPPPVVQPAPPPPPPPAAVAPPPPAVPEISPEVLAQIQQQFNIPAAPPQPPVAPPVQVPPPVMQPAPPPAAVAPPPPPVQVPPPTFVDEFEEPLNMDGMRGGIGSLPEAPPEAVAPPPVQVPPPVVQPETPTNQRFTAEDLVSQYNNSPGAQDFSLTATYDPATNTFTEDVSAFGFEGDAATNTYTPEEFINKLGYESANTSFTPPPDALVNMYNNSPGAQDFSLTATYDPETNTYTEDVSAFGFEGDAATNTYTPEEFMDRLGYGDPQPAPEPAVTPTIDPSLYSDPELGRGVELGFGDTRGGSPMSPRELMGSNYIEPRDGLGQVPPGQRVDVSEPTGIETMAESVGQGDYLGESTDTISLPDGSTFDLTNLDLSGIDIGGFGSMSEGFDLNNVNVGGVDPSLYSDPELGGGTRGEPLPDTRGGGPGFDPFAGVTGGLGPGGYGPEGGGFSPETEPAFNPPQGAVDEAVGTTYTPEFAFDPGLDFSGLDLSGLNLNLGEGFDANGFEGDFTFGGPGQGGPNGGPGMGNGPGNTMGNQGGDQGNQGGDPYNPTVNDTDNPYPFIPAGIDTSQMTPDMLAGLNTFYENGGVEGLNLNLGGLFGGSYTGPVGTGSTGGSYTVDPVDPVGDLGVGDDTGDASDPIDVTTPYVPPNVRSASSYGLTGVTPTRPVGPNPFQRPESQQGLGSLAGGG